jgi:hypothetical protein
MAAVLAVSMVGGTRSTEDDSMMSRYRLWSPNLRQQALLIAAGRNLSPLTKSLPLSMVQKIGQSNGHF